MLPSVPYPSRQFRFSAIITWLIVLGMLAFPVSAAVAAPASPAVTVRAPQQRQMAGTADFLFARPKAGQNPLASTVPTMPQSPSPLPLSPAINANTTITLGIFSTPYATHDSNSNADPSVWVVQAVITNTGAETATTPIIDLNMNSNASWFLLPGESRQRTLASIPPNATQTVYWFAHRSNTIPDPHTYTVTLSATNIDTVTQRVNVYNPLGATVETRSSQSTGNNGVVNTAANVVVGVAFTMTVDYDMGTNASGVTLQPNGTYTRNGTLTFSPSAYRLLSTTVQFRNGSNVNVGPLYKDRLYFPSGSLPSGAQHVGTSYTFVALRPANASLCPYTDVIYNSSVTKFDQFYCSSTAGTIVNVTGTLSISFTKSVNATTVQQGQLLTYTLRYTNTGNFSVQNVYLWDDIPANAITSTITPDPDPTPNFNTTDRVVWFIDKVAPVGSPGSTGVVTLTVLVNGRGSDIPNGTQLVNNGFLGILFNPEAPEPAITSTVTTTVLAPTVSISKSDAQTSVVQGQSLTYTLRVTNTGAVAASNLVVTDGLPSGVTYSGGAVPTPGGQSGQILTWSLASLASNGVYTIAVPVTVDYLLTNGALLTNSMQVRYLNPSGYQNTIQSATDVDVVQSPILSIDKTDNPDPALVGRNVTYTLRITNTGPATASNVLITDVLPTNTTYVSCSGGNSCGINAGNVISWAVPSLASNSSAVVTLVVQINNGLTSGTVITNQTYGVVSDQTDYVAGAPETTTVFNASAKVIGRAFVDANTNGVLDGGETGLAGVPVTLATALVPNTTTNAAGFYTFTVEQGGPISVSAGLPVGYFRTTASPVYLSITLETTTTVNFGYITTTADVGVVYGTVFHDLDHNGAQDLGETGLSTVTVSSVGALVSPVTTNQFGQYTLGYNTADTYTVTETNPPLYVSTTPDSVALGVVLHDSSQVDFGDFLGVRIEGQVFNDLNVNGVNDGGDSGLAGAVVSAGSDITTTGSSGNYVLFSTVQSGQPLTIAETDPAGYVSTAAVPGSSAVARIDTNTLRVNSPAAGTVYSGNDFGDAQASGVVSVTGQIFDDANADGLYNDGGVGLANGRVTASTGMFITTTSLGNFTLYAPPSTVVTVTETNPTGYVSTNALPGNNAAKYDLDTIRVEALTVGSASENNYFGDVILGNAAIITGVLFNDANNNGLFDTGEGVFPGEVVQISGTVSLITTTVSDGSYQFAVGVGTFLVGSSVPAGYYRTTPPQLAVNTSLGTTYPNRNFGFSNKSNVTTIFGTVFNDFNGNGLLDLGEVGLANAQVRLISGTTVISSVTTGAGGIYAFPIAQPGPYRVAEINPPGYFSTSPDTINLVVGLGTSYMVNFGDSNRTDVGSVHGLVFEDQNANGTQDPTEPGIAGVVITTTADSGGVVSATTQAQGQYSYGFDFVSQGFHTIYEINPPGYRSTTPDVVPTFVNLGTAVVVDFGDCQACSPAIQGVVFNDVTGDGVQQFSELGITGVTVTLYSGATQIAQTTTRPNGDYTFAIPQFGIYRVVETDPPFYHSTTPNEVHVSVVVSDTYIVNFGDSSNPLVSSLFGTVFNDANANAAFDLGEVGLANVSVQITGNFIGSPKSLTTNAFGQYTFQIEQAGPYTITETDLPGYVSTTPNVVKQNANLGVAYTNNFGDYNGTGGGGIRIEGKVFNDFDASGTENGEPGISGVTVSTSSGGTSTTTDSNGNFVLFAPSNAGPITITETDLNGYISTVAIPGPGAAIVLPDNFNRLRITAPISGTTYQGNKFGDKGQSFRFNGLVFRDVNADGSDSGDPLLGGATVMATGGTSMTTGLGGAFTVYAPSNIGPITITEVDPAGYVSTIAIAGSGAVTAVDANHLVVTAPTNGAIYNGNKFGDFDGVRVIGSIFEDRNVNAAWDVLYEPVVTATSVSLAGSGGLSAQTGATGVYTLYAKVVGGFISVTESVPSGGYVATTPTMLTFPGAVGQYYSGKNFGLQPPACGADAYEALNDNLYNTTGVTLAANTPQSHNFHVYDDKDWAKVDLQYGYGYTFTASASGARADTILALFASDGVTQIAQSNDAGTNFSSQIQWTAAGTGTYYVRVAQANATLAGCSTNYTLSMSVKPNHFIYMPLLAKNYP